ncbi:DNA repair protein complementing XP-C cells, partial [Trifolium medium]|nr:DNA repair protein complementing XP-C cells [Trifolium medium]
NDRGQVDVWSEKCLPPGTVHLRFPRAYEVAKRLEIDSAPAM